MRFYSLLLIINLLFLCQISAQQFDFTPVHDYDSYFQEAYEKYPDIPKGMLEAIAYTQTHIRHVGHHHHHESCAGLPHYVGVMGMIEDGKGWFNENLQLVQHLSNEQASSITHSPKVNILAYAKAYNQLRKNKNINNSNPLEHVEILNSLSEIPNDGTIGNDFAFDTYLYSVYTYLNYGQFQNAYDLPQYNLDLEAFFGTANYKVLSSNQVTASSDKVNDIEGNTYNGNVQRSSMACSDTNVPVIFTAADPSNYSSRNGTAITHVTIHTMQGSYSGSISWFQNPAANVSAHYNIRASDGQITQMVCEIDKAWHVSNSNPYAVGIEHEGYVEDASWYTENMYQASANLTADICSRNNIPTIRTYDVIGDTGLNPLGDGCYKVKGHQHFPNQTHVDPGQYWDWNKYYDLLNPSNAVTTNTYTTCSGSFQDPGGSGNSGNDEREFYLIAPTGAGSVTLTFNAFNLETNYDYLYVYDGDSYNDSLIAVLNGTSLPAPITGESGALFLEFRTDCATLSSGWDASWSCGAASTCGVPDGLTETFVSQNEVSFSWNAAANANSYVVRIKQAIEDNWSYHSSTTNQINIGGLAIDGHYLWGVSAVCSGNETVFNGTQFTHTASTNASYTTASCEGYFTDTGSTLANYQNNEDWTFTIAPTGASSIALAFTTFELESNYDYMYIYDGPNTSSPLIGTYTGTNSPGTINSSSGTLTIRFDSDNWTVDSGWEANWTCNSSDSNAPITEIGTIPNWVTSDFNLGFLDTDDNAIDRQFYQVNEFQNGEWVSNPNNGFLNDDFNVMNPNWNAYAGNWSVTSGSLYQADQNSSNTIFTAALNQNDADEYLYHWTSLIGGTGSNRRAGLHFFCDDPSASNRGNSYFVYYRIDSDLLQIYEVNSNTFSLVADIPYTFNLNQLYDFKVSYNKNSGKIDVWVDDVMAGTWTDTTPLTSAGYVSFRSGNCTYTINDFSVYQSRSDNEMILVGSDSNDDIQQQSSSPSTEAGMVRSVVVDANNNISLIDAATFKVDYTQPTFPTGITGEATDAMTITASWNGSSDSHSGMDHYEYAIGTSTATIDVIPWTYNGLNTSVTETGLSLVDGQDYHVHVRSVNGAGLVSSVISSPAFNYTAPGCSYSLMFHDNFEAGYGNWNNGGLHCRRHINDAPYANSGNYCVRLRDNTFYSKVTSDILDLTNYDEIRIDFSYYCRSMDNANEDFWLQVTYDNSSYTTVEEWNKGDEFQNNQRKYDSVTIPGPFSATTRFRFRCDASSLWDWVYLDNIKIYGCSQNGAREIPIPVKDEADMMTNVELNESSNISQLSYFPNPAHQYLNIQYELKTASRIQMSIMDVSGKLRMSKEIPVQEGIRDEQLDISSLDNGFYILRLNDGNDNISVKFVKI